LLVRRITQKNYQLIFTKFGEKVADGPRKKPFLDFGGNPGHVTSEFRLGYGCGYD